MKRMLVSRSRIRADETKVKSMFTEITKSIVCYLKPLSMCQQYTSSILIRLLHLNHYQTNQLPFAKFRRYLQLKETGKINITFPVA